MQNTVVLQWEALQISTQVHQSPPLLLPDCLEHFLINYRDGPTHLYLSEGQWAQITRLWCRSAALNRWTLLLLMKKWPTEEKQPGAKFPTLHRKTIQLSLVLVHLLLGSSQRIWGSSRAQRVAVGMGWCHKLRIINSRKTASAPFREASLIAGEKHLRQNLICYVFLTFLTKEGWEVEMQWFLWFNYLSSLWLLTLQGEAAKFRRLEVVSSDLQSCSFHFTKCKVLGLRWRTKNNDVSF